MTGIVITEEEHASNKAFAAAVMRGEVSQAAKALTLGPKPDVNWQNQEHGLPAIFEACMKSEEMFLFVLKLPTVDPNVKSKQGNTLFAIICSDETKASACLRRVMAHPNIDVAQQDMEGKNVFALACFYGNTECVKFLLRDPRVDLYKPDNQNRTPLWWLVHTGHIEPLRWWIASGLPVNFEAAGVMEEAKKKENISSLLQRFKSNPDQTMAQVRRDLPVTSKY
jgi:hypothetical protein